MLQKAHPQEHTITLHPRGDQRIDIRHLNAPQPYASQTCVIDTNTPIRGIGYALPQ